jgi:hypothetical protein
MVNKKGWLRIVEATIAALVIFGALVAVSKMGGGGFERDFNAVARDMLEEISKNASLRDKIVAYTPYAYSLQDNETINELKNFTSPRVGAGMNFEIRICNLNDICGLDSYVENVYASERVISTSGTSANVEPKKVKIFLWNK